VEIASVALALLASYLLGAIPFAFILCYLIKGVDVRKVGSGNVGATNAARAAGKAVGVVVFILDLFKGFASAYFVARLAPLPGASAGILCGCAAIVGHTFPVYLGFKGGKAVATSTGVFLALAPISLAVAAVAWCVVANRWRYVSLASIVAAIILVWTCAMTHPEIPIQLGPVSVQRPVTLFAALVAVLVLIRHRSNISRLLAGTEPKIGEKHEDHGTG